MKRLVTAAILIALVLAGTRWAPVPVFWAGVALLALLALREALGMMRGLGHEGHPLVAGLGTLALLACFSPLQLPLAAVTFALVAAAMIRAVCCSAEPAQAFRSMVGTVFAASYVGLCLGHVGGLLTLGAESGPERGQDLLIFALLVVYVGDTCALYGGKTFGRHKLAPRISPNKTWEGALFSLAGSIASSALGPLWFFQELPMLHALILGGLLGGAGILGDLAESMIKRAAAIKDTSRLLPGHGGVLDRLDSLLFAGPVLYWYHWYLLS